MHSLPRKHVHCLTNVIQFAKDSLAPVDDADETRRRMLADQLERRVTELWNTDYFYRSRLSLAAFVPQLREGKYHFDYIIVDTAMDRVDIDMLCALPLPMNFVIELRELHRLHEPALTSFQWRDIAWDQFLIASWIGALECITAIMKNEPDTYDGPDPKSFYASDSIFPDAICFRPILERLCEFEWETGYVVFAVARNLAHELRKRPRLRELFYATNGWDQHVVLRRDDASISFLLLQAAKQYYFRRVRNNVFDKHTTSAIDKRLLASVDVFAELWDDTARFLAGFQDNDDTFCINDNIETAQKIRIMLMMSVYILERGNRSHLFWSLALVWAENAIPV